MYNLEIGDGVDGLVVAGAVEVAADGVGGDAFLEVGWLGDELGCSNALWLHAHRHQAYVSTVNYLFCLSFPIRLFPRLHLARSP